MTVQPSRYADGSAMTIAGLAERYDEETRRNIPDLWTRFGPRIPEAKDMIGKAAYGVSETTMDAAGQFTYLAGVQVPGSRMPAGFTTIQIPARRYAVFAHRGHVSELSDLIMKVLGEWVPTSGHRIAGQPGLIEVYSEAFDPKTGRGGMEIWIAVKE